MTAMGRCQMCSVIHEGDLLVTPGAGTENCTYPSDPNGATWAETGDFGRWQGSE